MRNAAKTPMMITASVDSLIPSEVSSSMPLMSGKPTSTMRTIWKLPARMANGIERRAE